MPKHERPDAIESGVFQTPDKGKVKPGKRTPVYDNGNVIAESARTLGFDAKGLHTDATDDIVAKRIETDRSIRFYVKFSTAGSDIGHMFNPVGLYFREAEVRRDQAKTGRARYEFKQVPERAFHDYIQFLQTRTESFLRNAERQVLDA